MRLEKPRLPGFSPIPVSDAPPPPAVVSKTEEKKRTRKYILPADMEKCGYTPGCPGCRKILEGTPGAVGKTHNEKCRARIYKATWTRKMKGSGGYRKELRSQRELGGDW